MKTPLQPQDTLATITLTTEEDSQREIIRITGDGKLIVFFCGALHKQQWACEFAGLSTWPSSDEYKEYRLPSAWTRFWMRVLLGCKWTKPQRTERIVVLSAGPCSGIGSPSPSKRLDI